VNSNERIEAKVIEANERIDANLFTRE